MLNYFERGSITSCITTALDLTKQVNMLLIQHEQSSRIQTNKTRCQLNNDTSPHKVSEYSLVE